MRALREHRDVIGGALLGGAAAAWIGAALTVAATSGNAKPLHFTDPVILAVLAAGVLCLVLAVVIFALPGISSAEPQHHHWWNRTPSLAEMAGAQAVLDERMADRPPAQQAAADVLSDALADEREARARQIISEAEVTFRGHDWGDPLYTVALPTLNATVDVQAFSDAEARENAVAAVTRMLRDREA
ncbi:MAG: hypothetical protein JO186_10980 [Actinobacteria bacterium]|nr:hypothetical protein [Actinomycetota bacterium]